MENIVTCLEKWVERQGGDPLYAFLDSSGQTTDSYTYRRFNERSNYVAARLADCGTVRFGEPVLLVYEPGLEVLVAFFACLKLGALPVPVAPLGATGFKGSKRKLLLVAADAGARVVLASKRCHDQVQNLGGNNGAKSVQLKDDALCSLQWIRTDAFQGEMSEFPNRVNPTMFLQYTSGSTETPRGVVVSHKNVICNGLATHNQQTVGISWLPHYHDMGLIGYYLNTLLAGGRLAAFSDFSLMRRPLLWLQTITKFRGTITSAPNFAYEYMLRKSVVSDEDLESLDLSSVRSMMNASEPVRCETMTRFADRFAQCGLARDAVTAAYGLAEATLAVSQGGRRQLTVNAELLRQNVLQIVTHSADRDESTRLASSGRPLDGLDVRIVNPRNRQRLDEDEIGEIWLRGGSKAMGYWKRPELSAAFFEAALVNGAVSGGYLRTGDLGFFHGGELFICGRLKDVMIFRGKNYYPHDIESVVQRALPSNRPGTVAAFAIECEDGSDALAIVAEIKPRWDSPDGERICEEIRRNCRLEVEVFAAVKPGSIARTSSGKIARFECRRRWLAGEMEVLASHRPAEGDLSQHVLQDVLECVNSPGSENLTLSEAGVDSLALVSLSLFIKKLYEARGNDASDELFDLKMLQTVRVGELKLMIDEFQQQQQLPVDTVRQVYSARRRSIERRETELMRQDVRLADDIAPCETFCSDSNGTVLLTGATGFFGGFLLDALLRLSNSNVDVVVRSHDVHHAPRRIESALQRIATRDVEVTEMLRRRIRVLPGDLAHPRLGLTKDHWERIRAQASAIYHCGATVDYVRPYEALRKANVQGTEEALRLACEGREKSFHLISTTFIFGWSAPRNLLESDTNPDMQELDFGYAQTKWVAEQLVFEAARRGLKVNVFRPSLLTASRGGHYVQRDITVRVLSYMIRHGIAVDIENQVSFLPADVAADNLVAVSQLATSEDALANTYHLTADDYYSFPVVTETITRQFGYGFRYLDINSFVEHINRHCTKDDLLYPLVPFFNTNFRKLDRMRHKRYDNQQYRTSREQSGSSCPEPPLDETVAAIVEFLQRKQLIPASPRHVTTAKTDGME